MDILATEESLIEKMSIRARQAVGAVCFRYFCKKYDLNNREIDEFVDHLLKLATVSTPDEFVDWDQEGPELFESGFDDTLPSKLDLSLPTHLKTTFSALLHDVVEIGMCDAYAGTTDKSKLYLQKVIATVRQHGVEIPELEPFTVSSFDEMQGWGNPVTPEVITRWRVLVDQR